MDDFISVPAKRCECGCGKYLPKRKNKKWANKACKQKAYRQRLRDVIMIGRIRAAEKKIKEAKDRGKKF